MKDKKYTIFRLSRFLFFVIIFFILFTVTGYILRDKTSADTIFPYYKEEENTIDVFFMGASKIDEGISPMELWNKYGMASYNMANGGESIPTNYWKLKIALKTQHPKLVVLDLAYIFQTDKLANQPQRLHQFIDNTPLSIDKIKCICDLTEPGEWLNYLLNIRVYHSRWNSLTENDFHEIKTINKGGHIVFLKPTDDMSKKLNVLSADDKSDVRIYELCLTYIEKIQKLCEENGIDLLMITLPAYATGETNHGNGEDLQRIWNGFTDYADGQHMDYLNMMHYIDEIGIDFSKDYYNWSHPNYLGNKKLSDYVGKYIVDNYGIENHKNDPRYLEWNKNFEDYENWLKSRTLNVNRGEK